jgi:hypothetical protein
MALPASGPISFNDINVELGVAGTTQASLDQASYRTLAGVPSGTISLSNFYGKSNQFAFTIASNQTNANLRTLAVNAGWNESSKVVATIDSGIYISSNSTGTPALTVNGSFPGGVELINNGYIIGMGGNGGAGRSISGTSGFGGAAGSSGGLALSVSSAISVRNNETIGGGGGGGGGGSANYYYFAGSKDGPQTSNRGGGGGGGGRSGASNSSGGARGTQSGGNYAQSGTSVAGASGTSASAGSGGAGASYVGIYGGRGGNGGSWGASGATGGTGSQKSAGGPFGGGGAGAAISGNGSITWLATGTRLGAIA